jgi:uncharacterized protein (TIGR02145 family)
MRIFYFFVLFFLVLCFSATAQVGIGTITPDASAILDLTSTNKALLLPRMNQTQINAIANPQPGMLVFCTNCSVNSGCVQMYEDAGWHCINDQKIWFSLCNLYSLYYEVYFGNRVWLDRNLGAKTLPSTYADKLGYGSLFQWGRTRAGLHHCVDWSATPTDLSTTSSTQLPPTTSSSYFVITHADWCNAPDGTLWTVTATDNANNPCPDGYRVPTEGELTSTFASSGTTIQEMALSALHWAPAGYRRWSDGVLVNVGTTGYYWSKEAGVADPSQSVYGIYSNTQISGLETYRAQGMSVRCIKQ